MAPSPRTARRPVFLAWSLFALANLALFLADLRQDFNQMLIPCSGEGCNFLTITSTEVAVLESWGLTTSTYALFMSAVPVIVLLGLVYFGRVVVLQNLFGAVAGRADSPIITVISTLTIATLFTPLRRRIQAFIDRRFFRRKYDADQALKSFAEIARDEANMDRLAAALLGALPAYRPHSTKACSVQRYHHCLWNSLRYGSRIGY